MTQKNNQNTKKLFCISISYEKAAEEIRGKYALFSEDLKRIQVQCKEKNHPHFFVLSTCNRTELYTFSTSKEQILSLFATITTNNLDELSTIAEIFEENEAIQHFFEVGAGLKSQIIGDFEIIGQMKNWFNQCQKLGTINTYLDRLMNFGLQISKKVKNETQLSSGVTSVSYAAVNYILTQSDTPKDKNILLFGMGKIGRNTLENLVKHTQHEKVVLINRTIENIQKISDKFNVHAKGMESLSAEINHADIMIVATGASKPTVLPTHFSPTKKMMIIDLTIPSNVDKAVQNNPNIHFIGIDTLSHSIDDTIASRQEELPKAKEIISSHVHEFNDWVEKRKHAKSIKAFKKKLELLHTYEHNKYIRKAAINEMPENEITKKMIQRLTNHLAHHLIENQDKADETLAVINQVFKIH